MDFNPPSYLALVSIDHQEFPRSVEFHSTKVAEELVLRGRYNRSTVKRAPDEGFAIQSEDYDEVRQQK